MNYNFYFKIIHFTKIIYKFIVYYYALRIKFFLFIILTQQFNFPIYFNYRFLLFQLKFPKLVIEWDSLQALKKMLNKHLLDQVR